MSGIPLINDVPKREAAARLIITEANIAADCLKAGSTSQTLLEMRRLAFRALAISRDYAGDKLAQRAIDILDEEPLF